MTDTPARVSDLGVRTLSAVVMIAVAGTALWLGGWIWTAFVVAVALGVLWEWWGLVIKFVTGAAARLGWMASGAAYCGLAATILIFSRGPNPEVGMNLLLSIVLGVVGTDIGAYFAGRTFGGQKIAPSISPSKTWSGLFGGIVGASLMIALVTWAWASGLCEAVNPGAGKFGFDGPCSFAVLPPTHFLAMRAVVAGAFVAIVAQSGDFFESWMKRRAGVKDSGILIPGHGGLFDRVDGLLAVCFVLGLLSLYK